MDRITVTLTSEQKQALISLAKSLHREPRAQAAQIICKELQTHRLLGPSKEEIQQPAEEIQLSLTSEEAEALANSASSAFRDILESGDHKFIQEMLRGFIARIDVDRDGNKIIGSITYYLPTLDNSGPSPPGDTVAISARPLGAYPHRHSFTMSFTTAMRSYNRKRP